MIHAPAPGRRRAATKQTDAGEGVGDALYLDS